ncbi:MAG: hypothetical protein BWY98_01080 [Tenericutes bacterium ADurb.BinA155]|nr:MAG: hypothetical protein BWY98_01080 [Tenericutes bacterium ADurb.BinA155]
MVIDHVDIGNDDPAYIQMVLDRNEKFLGSHLERHADARIGIEHDHVVLFGVVGEVAPAIIADHFDVVGEKEILFGEPNHLLVDLNPGDVELVIGEELLELGPIGSHRHPQNQNIEFLIAHIIHHHGRGHRVVVIGPGQGVPLIPDDRLEGEHDVRGEIIGLAVLVFSDLEVVID